MFTQPQTCLQSKWVTGGKICPMANFTPFAVVDRLAHNPCVRVFKVYGGELGATARTESELRRQKADSDCSLCRWEEESVYCWRLLSGVEGGLCSACRRYAPTAPLRPIKRNPRLSVVDVFGIYPTGRGRRARCCAATVGTATAFIGSTLFWLRSRWHDNRCVGKPGSHASCRLISLGWFWWSPVTSRGGGRGGHRRRAGVTFLRDSGR